MIEYTLNIVPKTSPRPRLSKFGIYMPKEYKEYQKAVMWEMKENKIPKYDYSEIEVIMYFPYPKSTPKKKLIEGFPMRKKPDFDNAVKVFTDCMEKLELIENDSQIYKGLIIKLYTTGPGKVILKLL